MITAVKKV